MVVSWNQTFSYFSLGNELKMKCTTMVVFMNLFLAMLTMDGILLHSIGKLLFTFIVPPFFFLIPFTFCLKELALLVGFLPCFPSMYLTLLQASSRVLTFKGIIFFYMVMHPIDILVHHFRVIFGFN